MGLKICISRHIGSASIFIIVEIVGNAAGYITLNLGRYVSLDYRPR